MKNVAIIGVTGYGKVQFNICQRLAREGRIKLKAAVVVNPQDAGPELEQLEAMGSEVFSSADAMWERLAGQIDLCIIPAPIALHRPLTIQALACGSNVFVEKPLAGCLEDALAIRSAELASGKTVVVGFQYLFDPCTHAAKRYLLAGEIGPIRSISGYALWPRPLSYYQRNNWAGRIRNQTGWVNDSPFNNAMAHFIMLGLFFGGRSFASSAEISRVEAALYRANEIENFDTGTMRLQTTCGMQICFGGSHACAQTINPVIRVTGDYGFMEWTAFQSLKIYRENEPVEEIPFLDHEELRHRPIDLSLRRMDDPDIFVCTTEMALAHMRIIQEIQDKVPVQDIPASCTQTIPHEKSSLRVIPGIEQLLISAATSGKLLSELDLPWAAIPAAEQNQLSTAKLG